MIFCCFQCCCLLVGQWLDLAETSPNSSFLHRQLKVLKPDLMLDPIGKFRPTKVENSWHFSEVVDQTSFKVEGLKFGGTNISYLGQNMTVSSLSERSPLLPSSSSNRSPLLLSGPITKIQIHWKQIRLESSNVRRWREVERWLPLLRRTQPTPRTILDGLSGRALPGRLTAIMGASGVGKSSLFNCLAGKLASSESTTQTGTVRWVWCGGHGS